MASSVKLTKEQEDYIRVNYTIMDNKDIMKNLGITHHSFYKFIKSKGLSKQVQKTWTDEEVDYLINNYNNVSVEELGNYLGRAYTAIRKKASELGIKRDIDLKKNKWLDEERVILKDNYTIKNKEELKALLPNRSWVAIVQEARKLNVSKGHKWSREELDYLMSNYSKDSKSEILEKLSKRTWGAIVHKANKMGLYRD